MTLAVPTCMRPLARPLIVALGLVLSTASVAQAHGYKPPRGMTPIHERTQQANDVVLPRPPLHKLTRRGAGLTPFLRYFESQTDKLPSAGQELVAAVQQALAQPGAKTTEKRTRTGLIDANLSPWGATKPVRTVTVEVAGAQMEAHADSYDGWVSLAYFDGAVERKMTLFPDTHQIFVDDDPSFEALSNPIQPLPVGPQPAYQGIRF
jgi:hypothetical protein